MFTFQPLLAYSAFDSFLYAMIGGGVVGGPICAVLWVISRYALKSLDYDPDLATKYIAFLFMGFIVFAFFRCCLGLSCDD